MYLFIPVGGTGYSGHQRSVSVDGLTIITVHWSLCSWQTNCSGDSSPQISWEIHLTQEAGRLLAVAQQNVTVHIETTLMTSVLILISQCESTNTLVQPITSSQMGHVVSIRNMHQIGYSIKNKDNFLLWIDLVDNLIFCFRCVLINLD